jgi:translocation and assembly module TamB
MHKSNRIVKVILYVLITLLLSMLVILQTKWGKNRVSAILESQLHIEISNLSGFIPFSPRMEMLELKDKQGIWLKAEGVKLKLEINFFPPNFQVKHIEAEKLYLLRIPEAQDSASELKVPEIEFNKISLPHIEIDESVIGQHIILSMNGNLNISESSVGGKINIIIPEAKQLYKDLRGMITTEINLGGTLSEPQAKISSTLEDGDKTLKLNSLLKKNGQLLQLSNIDGGTSGFGMVGSLTYNMGTKLADGNLNINANDLSGLNPFMTENISGTGQAKVILTAINDKQYAEANGELAQFIYGNASADKVTFNFRVSDIIAMEGIEAEVLATQVKNGENIIDKLSLTATGSDKETQIVMDAEAGGDLPWRVNAQAQFEASMPDWKLRINKLQSNIKGHKVALATPVQITRHSDVISIPGFQMNIEKGSLRAEGFYSEHDVSLKFMLSNLPLSLLSNDNYNGDLGGNISVTGTAASPIAKLELRVAGLTTKLSKEGKFILNLSGSLEPNLLILQAVVVDIKGKSSADLRIPAQFSLSPFNLALLPDGKIEGKVNIDSGIGQFTTLFLPADQTLTGASKGILNLSGTLNSPIAEGKISINNGRYESLTTGTILNDVQVQLEVYNQQIKITQGTALAGNGNVSLSGRASVESPYIVSIQAVLKDAEIINMREASGVINGQMQVTGEVTAPLVSGSLELGPMEIRVPEGSKAQVPEVKTLNPQILPKQVWEKERKKKISGPANVRLNLSLKAQNRVYIRGRGLETEIRGAVKINGTMSNPEIEGQFTSIRGTYTLLDRELKINEGVLTFRGAMPPSPYLLMVAETNLPELTAGVRLEGPIRSPKLTLNSTPSRPEDEIMANLLFGRDIASITPFQGIQLAQAIQKLRGKDGGVDFLGKARNLLGIERLSIGKTESGKVGVEAGKQISEKIYIGVEGGADAAAGKVKTEIEIRPRFSVETEAGARSSGVQFNWKHDY